MEYRVGWVTSWTSILWDDTQLAHTRDEEMGVITAADLTAVEDCAEDRTAQSFCFGEHNCHLTPPPSEKMP